MKFKLVFLGMSLFLCSRIHAGGDPAKTVKITCDGKPTQVAEGLKVVCEPKTQKVEVKQPVYVAKPPKPFWSLPISAIWLDSDQSSINCGSSDCPDPRGCPETGGLGGAIGLEYHWASRWSLSVQAAYLGGPGAIVTVAPPLGKR